MSRHKGGPVILLLILSLAVGVEELCAQENPRGRDLTRLELQSRFAEVAATPEFKLAVSHLTRQGLELRLGEMTGGILPSSEPQVTLLSIPFGHGAQEALGYLGISNDEWQIIRFFPGAGSPVDFRVLGIEKRDGELKVVEKEIPSELLHKEADPLLEQDTVTEKAVRMTACSYVKKIRLHYACIDLSSNPFGYQYDIYVRTGYYNPKSPNWWACYRGSIHACPNPQTRFQSYPRCGFPPRHPTG